MFIDQVIYFGKYLGDHVKGRSPNEPKSLIEVPYVALLNVQALNFNVNLFSSPRRVPRPSYTFRQKFGRSGKGSFTEKANIVDRCSKCSAPECTGSKLQYEPFLLRSVFLDWVIHFGKIWRSGKVSFTEKAKIVNRGCLCSARESTASKLQYDLYFISVARSYTKFSISGKIWEIRLRVVHRKNWYRSKGTYVAHMQVQVLSFIMNHIFSLYRVPRPSYPFR